MTRFEIAVRILVGMVQSEPMSHKDAPWYEAELKNRAERAWDQANAFISTRPKEKSPGG